jgi:hypothetical protein
VRSENIGRAIKFGHCQLDASAVKFEIKLELNCLITNEHERFKFASLQDKDVARTLAVDQPRNRPIKTVPQPQSIVAAQSAGR